MISGGGHAIAARYCWLDEYGLRFESRSKIGTLPRASKRSKTRVSRVVCDIGERGHAEENKLSERVTASVDDRRAFVRCWLLISRNCRT